MLLKLVWIMNNKGRHRSRSWWIRAIAAAVSSSSVTIALRLPSSGEGLSDVEKGDLAVFGNNAIYRHLVTFSAETLKVFDPRENLRVIEQNVRFVVDRLRRHVFGVVGLGVCLTGISQFNILLGEPLLFDPSYVLTFCPFAPGHFLL